MNDVSAIVVQNLVKRFGDFTAVDSISFTIPRGEIFGFLGPNGAGKTTTIRVLLGLLLPTSGHAYLLGYDVVTEVHALQRRVGYMSQLFTLYQDLTPVENIDFYGSVYGLSRQELGRRREEIIEMAGLRGHEDKLTSSLSGGWRQRLALGCAVVHRPDLVFLDEPTAGVDPVSRREFWDLIYDLARGGTTVFVTTHYLDEAEHCQRVGFIAEGSLVALGTPAELKTKHMRGQVLEIACSDAESAVRVLKQAQQSDLLIHEIALYGALVHAVVPSAEVYRPRVASLLSDEGLDVRSIDWVAPSLEDVFISNVNRQEDRNIEAGGEV